MSYIRRYPAGIPAAYDPPARPPNRRSSPRAPASRFAHGSERIASWPGPISLRPLGPAPCPPRLSLVADVGVRRQSIASLTPSAIRASRGASRGWCRVYVSAEPSGGRPVTVLVAEGTAAYDGWSFVAESRWTGGLNGEGTALLYQGSPPPWVACPQVLVSGRGRPCAGCGRWVPPC